MKIGKRRRESNLTPSHKTKTSPYSKCKIQRRIYFSKNRTIKLSSNPMLSQFTRLTLSSELITLPWTFVKPATLAMSALSKSSTRWPSKSWILICLSRPVYPSFLFTCSWHQLLSLCGLVKKLMKMCATVPWVLLKHFSRIKCLRKWIFNLLILRQNVFQKL